MFNEIGKQVIDNIGRIFLGIIAFLVGLVICVSCSGCGMTMKATGSGGSSATVATPTPRRLPIDRAFNISGGVISFSDAVTSCALTVIDYNSGTTPNISLRVQDSALAGKSIIILTRGGNFSFTPTAGQIPDNFGLWVTTGENNANTFSLNATSNIVDPANADNYIQLMVDGVIAENYYLDDFLK
jgi:hypothetical protein